MTPQLDIVPRGACAARPLLVPPPNFRPLVGPTTEVHFRPQPYRRASGETAAQKSGLRYEEYVHQRLQAKFSNYIPAPYIHFKDHSVARTCQPDGVLLYDDCLFIFEIKYQHCPEAWWQLAKLYGPLLGQLFPSRTISLIEVCRSYDPATPFPCEIETFSDLDLWVSRPRAAFGVWQWRK